MKKEIPKRGERNVDGSDNGVPDFRSSHRLSFCNARHTIHTTVKSVSGGEFEKIEDGVYLIRAEENAVEVELRKEGRLGISLP